MFGKVHAWSRRYSGWWDVVWLLPLGAFYLATALVYATLSSAPGQQPVLPLWGFVTLSLLMLVPLFWRRSHPLTVFAVLSGTCFVQWLLEVAAIPANMSVLIAMFTVASLRSFRWAVAAGLVAELGIVLAMMQWNTFTRGTFFSLSAFVVTIWLAGIYANTRRRYLESLEERAERAERERDQQTQLAASAERARIARELHDVVAHNVSVMIVQADGAGYAIDGDPEQARRAVQTISSTGRQALAEMRRLVGVLREHDAGPEEYAPQPGLDQLDELVVQVRASGLPVEFLVSGTRQEIPEGEQLAIYRIVQEALTNTIKHGGPGAHAIVVVDYRPREIFVVVTDDGRGAAAPRRVDGHGLVGMRERVAMYGGRVSAEPRTGGGFEVAVWLPIADSGGTRAA
ncbi:sensor histidine kinase [Sinosporangium siamense]|uniref:sensor histidine kinase n=1 Tax=Sinosporangium siamense TaxID=1367973 RepID=UPI001EF36AE1|nr:sensor histidine kinase [Sinosporangium siamense]